MLVILTNSKLMLKQSIAEYVTLRINSGGTDVATSGNTSVNGSWEELSCSYTPAADEMASFQFVKTQGQLANIDKIKVICTSCPDKNYIFDFNDSKEGWLSGGGCCYCRK